MYIFILMRGFAWNFLYIWVVLINNWETLYRGGESPKFKFFSGVTGVKDHNFSLGANNIGIIIHNAHIWGKYLAKGHLWSSVVYVGRRNVSWIDFFALYFVQFLLIIYCLMFCHIRWFPSIWCPQCRVISTT